MARDLLRTLERQNLSFDAVMSIPLDTARASMIPHRVAAGLMARMADLLTPPSANIKLDHSSADRVAAWGLFLSPADVSGVNVCRYATKGCRAACLATSGMGRHGSAQRGKLWKTTWLAADPAAFLRVLVSEIDRIPVAKWSGAGWLVSLRLNGTSDIPWETVAGWVVDRARARGINVYDYTKWPTSKRPGVAGYTLAQSVHEKTTDADIAGMTLPVVVVDICRGRDLPSTWKGRAVVDGDRSDARFLDQPGSVVLLRYKDVQTTKRAAAVASGFVRSAAS